MPSLLPLFPWLYRCGLALGLLSLSPLAEAIPVTFHVTTNPELFHSSLLPSGDVENWSQILPVYNFDETVEVDTSQPFFSDQSREGTEDNFWAYALSRFAIEGGIGSPLTGMLRPSNPAFPMTALNQLSLQVSYSHSSPTEAEPQGDRGSYHVTFWQTLHGETSLEDGRVEVSDYMRLYTFNLFDYGMAPEDVFIYNGNDVMTFISAHPTGYRFWESFSHGIGTNQPDENGNTQFIYESSESMDYFGRANLEIGVPVPEPSSFVLMLSSMALLGGMVRRRT